MATFYLIPSRLTLGQRFGDFLGAVFPGLKWQRGAWPDLAETLATAAGAQPRVYVIFGEDLADDEGAEEVLARDCGAEPGDEIVEFDSAHLTVRRWKMGAYDVGQAA